jgi:hypothetical protein
MMNVLIAPHGVGAHYCQPGMQLHRAKPTNWAALLMIGQTLDCYRIQSELGEGPRRVSRSVNSTITDRANELFQTDECEL